MAIRDKLMSSAAPFAHLLGLAPRAADDKPEDEKERNERDRREGESDAEYDERMKKLDEEAAAKAEKEEAARADAEDGDPDNDEDEDEDGDDTEAKKAKARARKSFARGVQGGRAAERARCRAIFGSPHAGVRPDVAASLAFETRMSVKEALAVLAQTAVVKPRGSSLREAMTRAATPRVSAGGTETPPADSPQALAQQILAAGRKARGVN